MQILVVMFSGFPEVEGDLNPLARKFSENSLVAIELFAVPIVKSLGPSRLFDTGGCPGSYGLSHVSVASVAESYYLELTALFGHWRSAGQV